MHLVSAPWLLLLLFQIAVPSRVRLKRSLPSNRSFDIGFRNLVFFGERVAEDRQIPPVKEVQNPVVHSSLSNPQLIDAVSQDVRKGPPQLAPKSQQASQWPPRSSRM